MSNQTALERLSRRIVFFETPAVAEEIERRARSNGAPVAAEVRRIIREALRASERADQGGGLG
jgi:hypothetical protein